MKPEVSVIIPAFNAEPYLAETIDSVLAQQPVREIEILVVDDGSTDGTLDLARSFAPRVTALTQKNGGPASARNHAIRHSAGKYLAFLDSDDLWMKDTLARQTAFLDANPEVGLVYGEALMFRAEGNEKKILGKIGFTGDASFRLLLYGDYIPNSTVMIRRDCVDRVGLLNESRDLIAVEDYEYWMRIARVYPIAALPEALAMYRIREGNLMGDGADIEKGLSLSIAALAEMERLYPSVWAEQRVDRQLLLARLHIRAGFAWKQRGNWPACLRKYLNALGQSSHPRVFRWILAATMLNRWS